MRLTTKRNRWYFLKELFSYMIPMILIVGTVDVFYHFVQCPLHPEWSAPCCINWILSAMYGIPLILTIILTIIFSNKLKKIKKQIENDLIDINNKKEPLEPQKRNNEINKELQKEIRPKNTIAKSNKRSDKKRKISRKTK